MSEENEREPRNPPSEDSDAPQIGRLTIEVPTEIEAGLSRPSPTCTCPPGCLQMA